MEEINILAATLSWIFAAIPLFVSALLLKSQKHCIFLCSVSTHEYLCIYSPSASLLFPHTLGLFSENLLLAQMQ